MDTVKDVFGSYYQEKSREISSTPSLTPEAVKLWREMEQAAHAHVYQGRPSTDIDAAVDRLVRHPGCTWKRSTIEYWIRQHYYK